MTQEVYNPVTALVAGNTKVVIGAASTAEQALPSETTSQNVVGKKFFVTTSTACFVKVGATGLGAASSSDYTFYFPANFFGIVRAPGTFVRAIQDTAAGTLNFMAIFESDAS